MSQINLITRLIGYILLVTLFIFIYNNFDFLKAKFFPIETKITQEKINEIENTIATPTKISIPKLGIDTEVLSVGKARDGSMDVPNSLQKVGWYKFGTKPGARGNAVIAGHEVDSYGLGVVFRNLVKLEPGDQVYVTTGAGQVLEFVVKGSEVYKYNEAPLENIFGVTDERNLNLITCSGNFLRNLRTKDLRLVVYTKLRE